MQASRLKQAREESDRQRDHEKSMSWTQFGQGVLRDVGQGLIGLGGEYVSGQMPWKVESRDRTKRDSAINASQALADDAKKRYFDLRELGIDKDHPDAVALQQVWVNNTTHAIALRRQTAGTPAPTPLAAPLAPPQSSPRPQPVAPSPPPRPQPAPQSQSPGFDADSTPTLTSMPTPLPIAPPKSPPVIKATGEQLPPLRMTPQAERLKSLGLPPASQAPPPPAPKAAPAPTPLARAAKVEQRRQAPAKAPSRLETMWQVGAKRAKAAKAEQRRKELNKARLDAREKVQLAKGRGGRIKGEIRPEAYVTGMDDKGNLIVEGPSITLRKATGGGGPTKRKVSKIKLSSALGKEVQDNLTLAVVSAGGDADNAIGQVQDIQQKRQRGEELTPLEKRIAKNTDPVLAAAQAAAAGGGTFEGIRKERVTTKQAHAVVSAALKEGGITARQAENLQTRLDAERNEKAKDREARLIVATVKALIEGEGKRAGTITETIKDSTLGKQKTTTTRKQAKGKTQLHKMVSAAKSAAGALTPKTMKPNLAYTKWKKMVDDIKRKQKKDPANTKIKKALAAALAQKPPKTIPE